MRTVMHKVVRAGQKYTSNISYRWQHCHQLDTIRPFHSSTTCRRDDDGPQRPRRAPIASAKPVSFKDTLDDETRCYYNSLPPDEQKGFEEMGKSFDSEMTTGAGARRLEAKISRSTDEAQDMGIPWKPEVDHYRPGAMNMGELDDTFPDEEFAGDDITSLAHGELEQHREMREYARIAAWEMPLLTKLAKPFEPPTLKQLLRFRYTTYMGEQHPASSKIVVEFCTRDLPDLTEPQRIKFIKLVGPRYNPETDVVKMSCESFEHQAQNKRYLGDLVENLVAEAKNNEDMYEDVPLDFRHHKFKRKLVFPEEWKLTPERRAQLEANRQQALLAEKEKAEQGQLANGMRLIQEAITAVPVQMESPLTLVQQQGKGRGKQKQVR